MILKEDLIENIKQRKPKSKTLLITIDGTGGSGKTTLAEYLQSQLSPATIIQLDDFYSPELGKADLQRLKEQVLEPLHHNRQAKYQIYEWDTNSFSDWKILEPGGIVIFEGVYSLDSSLRNYYDYKIWIEYPTELGSQRGIKRDLEMYGIDTTDKWKNIWTPKEEEYKQTQKPYESADAIIDGTIS